MSDLRSVVRQHSGGRGIMVEQILHNGKQTHDLSFLLQDTCFYGRNSPLRNLAGLII